MINTQDIEKAEEFANWVVDSGKELFDIGPSNSVQAVMTAAWEVRGEVRYAKEALVGTARQIAERMTELADKVERDGIATSVNGIGELQGRGPELDTLCKQFTQVQKQLVMFHQLAKVAKLDGQEES